MVGIEGLGQAEVDQFDKVIKAPAPGEDNVRRLDVAMDEANAVGFDQRLADLHKDADHSPIGLRAVADGELLEVDPVEVLHGVVEDPLRRPAVVEDRDGVRVSKLAGELDLALEPGDRPLIGLLGFEKLDGGRPAQHGMLGPVDDAHAALADLALERVSPESVGDQRGRAHAPEQPRHQPGEDEERDSGGGQKRDQAPQGDLQDRQGPKRLGFINLGDHAEIVFGQPGPGADDGYSAVITIAVDVHAGRSLHGLGDQPDERLLAAPRAWAGLLVSC